MVINLLGFLLASHFPDLKQRTENQEMPTSTDQKISLIKSRFSLDKEKKKMAVQQDRKLLTYDHSTLLKYYRKIFGPTPPTPAIVKWVIPLHPGVLQLSHHGGLRED